MDRTDQLSALDRRFGEFIAGFSPAPDPHVALAAALVSRAAGRGDACLELSDVERPERDGRPDAKRWFEALARSPAVGRPGRTPR